MEPNKVNKFENLQITEEVYNKILEASNKLKPGEVATGMLNEGKLKTCCFS